MTTVPSRIENIPKTSKSKAKKRPAPAMPADVLAALYTLPDPTPDAPCTKQYSNSFVAFRSLFNSLVVKRYLPVAAGFQGAISSEAARRWRLIRYTPFEDDWTIYAARSQEMYGPNPNSRGNKRQRARERKLKFRYDVTGALKSRKARVGSDRTAGSPSTATQMQLQGFMPFQAASAVSASSSIGSSSSSPNTRIASLSPHMFYAPRRPSALTSASDAVASPRNLVQPLPLTQFFVDGFLYDAHTTPNDLHVQAVTSNPDGSSLYGHLEGAYPEHHFLQANSWAYYIPPPSSSSAVHAAGSYEYPSALFFD